MSVWVGGLSFGFGCNFLSITPETNPDTLLWWSWKLGNPTVDFKYSEDVRIPLAEYGEKDHITQNVGVQEWIDGVRETRR